MKHEIAKEKLISALQARGYACRIVPIQRLHDLEEEINSRHRKGVFYVDFYNERLSHFDFNPPENMPEAKSILVIAVPVPKTRMVFHFNEKTLPLVLPPTYVGYTILPPKIADWLNTLLSPLGHRVVRASAIPLKPLAVRSGLAEYGKNNITYVSGMGSFHQLVAFCTDLPCRRDEWREMKMLDRCQTCKACLRKCQTGAIAEDRFLLHAERCLVFHNERPANIPFPKWIDPTWHNCLFGCMDCQYYCPEDKAVRDWAETLAEFSHEETMLLANGATLENLSAETISKLERLELTDSLDQLPRNLGVFIRRLETE